MLATFPKRSISIASPSANWSHGHPSAPPLVSGKQFPPGVLAVSALDRRHQPPDHKPKSPASKKKPHRPRDTLSASISIPASFRVQGRTSNFSSEFPIVSGHPSGKLPRAPPISKSRSLSGAFSTAFPSSCDTDSDPFVSTVPFSASQAVQKKSIDFSTPAPASDPPTRRRTPQIKSAKPHAKEFKKEINLLWNPMTERIAEGVSSDTAMDDVHLELEDVAIPFQPLESPSASLGFTTPPPSPTSHGFAPTRGVSAPITVPQRGVSHDASPFPPPLRTRHHNSMPTTPPRHSTSQTPGLATSWTLPSHTRSSSHPHFFSTSAPSSPSHPLIPGTRYANSSFQHAPSPNVLPKPKFLENAFMEVDEVS